ncbi:MAG TPA: hypothetical protein VJQ25_06555 [Nitrospira sp.]|nr:hypothetical protein [Nitrospira sp.]
MPAKRHLILILFSIILTLHSVAACSANAQPLQGERWVIFPAKEAKAQSLGDWLATNGQTAEYWTPSEDNVLALENGLGSYLEQSNSESFNQQPLPIWERLDEYNRQYIGILLDNKKVIYANYFCDSSQIDWRKDFVFVMDGGDCFFQFKYDVDSAEFFDLQVNGNA